MAHFAFLDPNNVVVEVIVGSDELGMDWEARYGLLRGLVCKQTSYNTRAGKHLQNKTPFRKNYAGIGYVYDEGRDAFIPPKPYPSWKLNEDTCLWEAPVPMPEGNNQYAWDENSQAWIQSVS